MIDESPLPRITIGINGVATIYDWAEDSDDPQVVAKRECLVPPWEAISLFQCLIKDKGVW